MAKPSDISKSQAEIFALVWTRLGPLHDRRPSIHLVNEQRALRARCVAVAAAAGITHNSGEEEATSALPLSFLSSASR